MKKFIYVGYAISEEECSNASGVSVAGNKMQLNVLKELCKYSEIEIAPITVYPCAAYPHDSKLIYRREQIELWDGYTSVRVGFINIPFLKQICQMINVYLEIEKQRKKNATADIFSFNVFPQIGTPLRYLKTKYKDKIQIHTLLADPPVFINNKLKRTSFFMKMFVKIAQKNICAVDRAIVLNQYAADIYLNQRQKYIVIEGGIANSENEYEYKPYALRKHEMIFSGALEEYNGILTLLEAMKIVKSDVILKIYGDGSLREHIMREEYENESVRYMGNVSNEVMMKLQKEAYMLVNPRPTSEPISKVTFPSKTFEYLSSGTVVLSTKLNGYSQEYLDKMVVFDEDNAECMARVIDNVMEMDVCILERMAERARRFIVEDKNWTVQGKKIFDFLME